MPETDRERGNPTDSYLRLVCIVFRPKQQVTSQSEGRIVKE